MKTYFQAFLLICGFALLAACTPQTPGSSVAVLDLGKIAQETGHAGRIQDELNKSRDELNTQIQSLRSSAEQKFNEFGQSPTDEQRQELSQMLANVQKAQASANAQLQNKQAQLFIELRNKVQPLAKQIANERGFSVVLMQNETVVLAVEEQSDITNDVIELMKKQGGGDAEGDNTQPAAADK